MSDLFLPSFTDKILLSERPLKALELFYEEVCKRAEQKMLITHKLEGAHYNAMKEILKELGILDD